MISITKYFLNSLVLFTFIFSGISGVVTSNQNIMSLPLSEPSEVEMDTNPASACNTCISEEEINELTDDSTLLINEVMFNPAEGEYEWIELKNIGPDSLDISGYFLTDEDDNWFEFPLDLPVIPAGAFVVIIFDGLGQESDDYDFSDNCAILHSQSGLINIFENDMDQVSIYRQPNSIYLPLLISSIEGGSAESITANSSNSNVVTGNIVSFVAWGASPDEEAENAANKGLWDESWFVSLSTNHGVEYDYNIINASIGLLPNSQQSFLDDWVLFQPEETTKSYENIIPVISFFDPADGEIVDGSTFSIGWNAVNQAISYHFQLDDNDDFSSPLIDENLAEPVYISPNPIVDGIYYWRVKIILDENESNWSLSRLVETIDFGELLETENFDSRENRASSIKVIPITWQLQHKDTNMLCLDGDKETGNFAWDSPQTSRGTHGNSYCARAALSMMVSYYGSNLSQDRISYQIFGRGSPEGDLGHDVGTSMQQTIDSINWAFGETLTMEYRKPTFDEIKSWIDNDQPIYSIMPGHARLIVGYYEDATYRMIKLLDPWDQPKWKLYFYDLTYRFAVGPSGSYGAPNVRMEEDEDDDGIPDTMDDSDIDGIVDFDERYRFGTGVNNPDTDYDGVTDKLDMREYLFDNNGNYRHLQSDIDRDGLRKERDRDNDRRYNNGSPDGCEDFNYNGKWEPGLGETDNLNGNSERRCSIPTLNSPADNSALNTLIPLLQWDNGGATDISNVYLDYSIRSNFLGGGGSWYGPSWYEEFQISHNLNPSTEYFWRVYFMKDGNQEPYSEVWSFTTGSGGTILPAPNLVSPANGSTLSTNIVTFRWSPVNGALGYEIHWKKSDANTTSSYMVDGSVTTLEWGMQENTTYEWWVEAYNSYAMGDDSTTWEFTAGPQDTSSSGINSEQDFLIEVIGNDRLYKSIYSDVIN